MCTPTAGKDDRAHKYALAIELIKHQVQLLWLIFTAFLLTETVLLAAIATTLSTGHYVFLTGLSMLGLALTAPWWTTFSYNHGFYLLRVHEARALEPEQGTFFTNGNELREKGASSLELTVQISSFARFLCPSRAVRCLIIAFILAFLTIFICCASVVAYHACCNLLPISKPRPPAKRSFAGTLNNLLLPLTPDHPASEVALRGPAWQNIGVDMAFELSSGHGPSVGPFFGFS